MPQNDIPLGTPRDILTALGLLTRLPVPPGKDRGAASAWAWPLAGVAVALLAAATGNAALFLGLNGALAALLALACQTILTGAMHEDGLADCADGFWGGWTRERRLAIMKDSQIGTYGVMALVLVTLLRWQALALIFTAGSILAPLIAAAALSRAPMAMVMAALPNARGSGLSQSVGQPAARTAALSLALAVVIALLATGWVALAALLPLGLATLAILAIARAKIGGQTGDVLGAMQQIAEVTVLLTLAAALP